MKKIAILTFCTTTDNYGQVLQCYALQQFLRNNGHAPYLIRYLRKHTLQLSEVTNLLHFLKLKRFIQDTLRNLFHSLKYGKSQRVYETYNTSRRFLEFKQNHIHISTKEYTNIEELRATPPEGNVFIVGSDQVWNVGTSGASPVYFLDFGSPTIKRIAYAASFGKDKPLPNDHTFENALTQFDAVSCREPEGVDFCKKANREDAMYVLDPTLLLSSADYLKVARSTGFKSDYIYMYVVNISTYEEVHYKEIHDLAYREDKELHITISQPTPSFISSVDFSSTSFLTVEQWLSAVKHASFFVTSSFHGLAFALVFNTPFAVLLPNNKFNKTHQRFKSLLDALGLSDRICTTFTQVKEVYTKPIDWDIVNDEIESLKKSSIDFLLGHL